MQPIVSTLCALLAFGLWLGFCVWKLSQRNLSGSLVERLLFGVTVFACLVTSAALVVYFTAPVTLVTSAVALLAVTLVVIAIPLSPAFPRVTSPLTRSIPWYALGVLLVSQGSVIFLLCVGRTSEPLVSPWLLFPGSIYILFLLSTMLTAYVCTRLGRLALPFASLQTFIAIGVSAIVYGIGFGFDPFIHRAAEAALVQTGVIEPTSLLYSGQYAVVGWLHFVTTLPTAVIDIWLLPVLTSLFLPWAAYVGLRHGWGVREEAASLGWLAALFIPFMLFTFTVPFTIAYVLFAGVLFLFPLTQTTTWWLLLCWVGLISVFFHPLLGVPILLLAFFSGGYHRLPTSSQKMGLLIGFMAALFAGVPTLLMIYQQQADSAVHLRSLGDNVFSFVSLFANPFNNYHPSIRLEYHLLYLWRYWQPMLLTLIAYPVLLKYGGLQRGHGAVLVTFAAGLFGCIYAVSTLFVFKGIISHEQHEFALRLLQALYIVPIPLLIVMFDRIYDYRLRRWLLLGTLCFAVTLSWYFSYPQFNAKFAYYSPSVSRYDLETVRDIDADSQGRPYLVLSNQMTSAAALQEFGFANYYRLHNEDILWYAIPTGGKLYEYYTKIIYGEDPSLLDELMTSTGTEHVYVVMPTYWSWSPDTLRTLEVQSSQQLFIEDKLIIYRFDTYADEN